MKIKNRRNFIISTGLFFYSFFELKNLLRIPPPPPPHTQQDNGFLVEVKTLFNQPEFSNIFKESSEYFNRDGVDLQYKKFLNDGKIICCEYFKNEKKSSKWIVYFNNKKSYHEWADLIDKNSFIKFDFIKDKIRVVDYGIPLNTKKLQTDNLKNLYQRYKSDMKVLFDTGSS